MYNKMQINARKTKFVNYSHTGFVFPLDIVYRIDNCIQNYFGFQTVENVRHLNIWELYWTSNYIGKSKQKHYTVTQKQ